MNKLVSGLLVSFGLVGVSALAVVLWPGRVSAQGAPDPEGLPELRQRLQTASTVQVWLNDNHNLRSGNVGSSDRGFFIADSSGRALYAHTVYGSGNSRWFYDDGVRKKIACSAMSGGQYLPAKVLKEEPFPQGPFILAWLRAGMPSLPVQPGGIGRARLVPDLPLPPNTHVEFGFQTLGMPEDGFATRIEPNDFHATYAGVEMAGFESYRVQWDWPIPEEFYSDDLDDLCSDVFFHSVWGGATSPPLVNGKIVGAML